MILRIPLGQQLFGFGFILADCLLVILSNLRFLNVVRVRAGFISPPSAWDTHGDHRQVSKIRRAYGQSPAALTELKDLLKELAVDEEVQKEIVAEAAASISRIEQSMKENRENEEKLAKLRAEDLLNDGPPKK